MRLLSSLLAVSVLAFLAMFVPAQAQMPDGEGMYAEKPLLAIRYNQPRVYFGKALDKAVASANRAKSDMVYNLVAYVPESVSARTARGNLRHVVEGIMVNGVPANRITWRTEPTSSPYLVIHLYVE